MRMRFVQRDLCLKFHPEAGQEDSSSGLGNVTGYTISFLLVRFCGRVEPTSSYRFLVHVGSNLQYTEAFVRSSRVLESLSRVLLWFGMTYIYIMHTLILLLLGSTSAFLHQPGQRVTLSPLKRLSLFSYRPTTYTAVNIPTKAQYPLLIKDSERSLIEQASNFKSFAESESSIVQSWIEKGAAFWSDSAGIEALHITEHSTRVLSQSLVSAKGWLAADLYVDCGEEG